MSRPLIPVASVIVPTRNRPAELREALVSITGQQGIDLCVLEVIVVGDAGTPINAAPPVAGPRAFFAMTAGRRPGVVENRRFARSEPVSDHTS
ncbi:MAG TPA: glycosyltransferase [Amycolatopsis sp.]|jgi:hypothetical protein|nr:glycosyltransferase [Amycolatopsis sp.]